MDAPPGLSLMYGIRICVGYTPALIMLSGIGIDRKNRRRTRVLSISTYPAMVTSFFFCFSAKDLGLPVSAAMDSELTLGSLVSLPQLGITPDETGNAAMWM